MKKILFQGDSITEAGRSKENDRIIGCGYAMLVTAELECEYPNEYTCVNRGVGGNRIVDLYARIKSDVINLKPDIISIHVGINDVGYDILHNNGTSPDKYYKIYSMMIEEIKEALPDVKIMIMEPFVLEGHGTAEHIEEFRAGCREMSIRAKKISDTYGLTFVPLQDAFDKACQTAPSTHWVTEGVHPHPAGHGIIKREWLKAFKTLSK